MIWTIPKGQTIPIWPQTVIIKMINSVSTNSWIQTVPERLCSWTSWTIIQAVVPVQQVPPHHKVTNLLQKQSELWPKLVWHITIQSVLHRLPLQRVHLLYVQGNKSSPLYFHKIFITQKYNLEKSLNFLISKYFWTIIVMVQISLLCVISFVK